MISLSVRRHMGGSSDVALLHPQSSERGARTGLQLPSGAELRIDLKNRMLRNRPHKFCGPMPIW
jgi:hypothetical protein